MKSVLCGLGNMGSNHLRVCLEAGLTEIVGLVDASPERLSKGCEKASCRGFTDLEEALAKTQADCVIIASATDSHHKLGKIALTAGKATFIEKPLARTVEEATELCRLAKARRVPLMVGHIERFNPAVVAAMRLVRDGSLGEIVNISIKRLGGTPRDIKGAGDVLVDLAVHDVDLVSYFLGKAPKLVNVIGHSVQTIDSATMLLQCGAAAIDINVNWITPIKVREILITGVKGLLQINLITQKVIWVKQNSVLASDEALGDFPYDKFLSSFSRPTTMEVEIHRTEPLREELTGFFTALKNGLTVPVSGEQGLSALKIAAQARASVERRLASQKG